MILQRCKNQKCRNLFDTSAHKCTRCGQGAPWGLKNLYFRLKHQGKRHIKAVGKVSLEEAKLLHAAWVVQVTKPPTSESFSPTFGEIKESYLAKLRAEGKAYEKTVKKFLERMEKFWNFKDRPAIELTPEMIQNFQAFLIAVYSPAYVDRHIEMGRSCWNHSLRRTPNPFSEVKYYKPDNTLVRFLTPKEKDKLLTAAKTQTIVNGPRPKILYAILATAIYTGLRKQNILRLHTNEVDFTARMIRLRQKRDRQHEIYMNSVVFDALKALAPRGDGHFFVNPKTGRPYTDVAKSFAALKKKAGIRKPFRFHDQRHHFGTTLGAQTGNVFVVREAMGLSNLKTPMKYVHPIEEQIRIALDRLADGSPERSPTIEND